MNDIEWQQYLATLPKDLADALYHTMERVNTVINRARERAHGEHQELHQRIDARTTTLNDLRTIVRDLADRVYALEGGSDDDAERP